MGKRRRIINWLTALSLLLCMAWAALWVRSPSVFDRISWTSSSGTLWEVTSIWGDLAVVRVEQWPVRVSLHRQVSSLEKVFDSEFRPIADCMLYRDPPGMPAGLWTWGRGFSQNRGALDSGPYPQTERVYFHLAFQRWTVPLWVPAFIFSFLPAMRFAARVRGRRHRCAGERTGFLRGVARASPMLLLALILLGWWHSYWAMNAIEWGSEPHVRQVAACRGIIALGNPIPGNFNRAIEHAFSQTRAAAAAASSPAMPTTIPYSDHLSSPSPDSTYRRRDWLRAGVVFEQFTLEPDPWDLDRMDIPLCLDFRFDETPTRANRWGFFSAGDGACVGIPFWLLAVLTAIIPIRQLISWRRCSRSVLSNVCPVCGYDLRATPDRCPECGTAVEAKA